MIWVIGEFLLDIFPKYSKPGGAPFNFAYHLTKLGLEVRLITRIGRDQAGKALIEYASGQGLNPSGIQTDEHLPTGKVNVTLDNQGVPEFQIVPESAYDSIAYDRLLPGESPVALIYFGTLIQRTGAGHRRLQDFLSSMKGRSRLFCDLNLRSGWYNDRVLTDSLEQADILKLNGEELNVIRRALGGSPSDEEFMLFLSEQFRIDTIALTRGSEGSSLYHQGRFSHISTDEFVRSGRDSDTVGAGDAYAAVLAWGTLRHWPPARILCKASELAARICSIPGAVPDDNRIYEGITGEWSEDRI